MVAPRQTKRGNLKTQARDPANGRRATLVDVDIEGVKKNTDNMNKYVGVMAEMDEIAALVQADPRGCNL